MSRNRHNLAQHAVWVNGLFGFSLACSGETPARAQWLVIVDSDAPVPVVGDRVLVELLNEEGLAVCDACRRQIGLDERDPWPVSFGIAADTADPPLVRARLYRAVNTGSDGLPLGGAILDAAWRLPHTAGLTEVKLSLQMACLGQAVDLSGGTSCAGKTGERNAIDVASQNNRKALNRWPLANDTECEGAAPEGSTCIPGGAFVRGDLRAIALEDLTAPTPEEVVVLSAFYLDQDELTVGQYRRLLLDDPTLPEPISSGSGAIQEPGLSPFIPGTNDPAGYCTYRGANDSTNDALPLNCVSRALAEQLCRAREMRLPTEAEWEFAAGNRTLETRFPWGNDTTDPCAHAVFGLSYEALGVGSSRCRTQRPEGDRDPWVRAGGADRDVTELGIKNLSGNLSEWLTDTLVRYSDACWSRSPWLVDPECDAAGGESVVRGGNWRDGSFMLESTSRNSAPGSESIAVGFRCARDAGPK